jgi:hypothetical protein
MIENSTILLSTAYFGPVRYFSKLAVYPQIFIEQHENFIKQTYRNRTVILGPNGTIPLIVPVEKGREKKICIKELRIAYDEEWQRTHWRTIFSAYNSSPFFEYYADDLEPFFRKKFTFLFDINQHITETLVELLEIPNKLSLTESFEHIPQNCLNFRESISPKVHRNIEDPSFEPKPYTQVFAEKFGFIPDLSILDLLFNEGPSARSVLIDSFKKP